jgi:hypothetical protein
MTVTLTVTAPWLAVIISIGPTNDLIREYVSSMFHVMSWRPTNQLGLLADGLLFSLFFLFLSPRLSGSWRGSRKQREAPTVYRN